jgi:hypothetical protein
VAVSFPRLPICRAMVMIAMAAPFFYGVVLSSAQSATR